MNNVPTAIKSVSASRFFLSFIILALLLGLVACASDAEEETAVSQAVPTTQATISVTEAVLPTNTATPLPATPTPTMTQTPTATVTETPTATATPTATRWSAEPHPLQIEVMRQQSYPGSEIIFEQTLEPEETYNKYVVSYQSDGLKIYALMTVPIGPVPDTGWPVIVFNHGYVQPSEYSTTGNYVPYMDLLASSG